ncbi:hypothetical protein [Kingella negevensis]|uniref:Uncharacterized protein n=1 Tax=Kingella negevensis TaxID=1522312 RepID=A0A238TD23_9NEIS|nr:hypothetical protein [Kingella negevensis]MDK4688284.1 hypothetical protein [Kingella negevensis]WII94062.1 hypothetical protein QEO94_04535 [Kingella negevensis]SNB79224.1 Uncharacterised protein [Kingella negevensis]
MAVKTVFRKKNFHIDVFSGMVLDYNQRVETEITGGHYAPIGSQSHTHTQIFIQDEQGQEYSFNTHNWDLPIRVGHELNVYVFKKSGGDNNVIAVKNINLNQNFITSYGLDNAIKLFYRPFLTYGLMAMFGVSFAAFFIIFVIIQPEPDSLLATLLTWLTNLICYGGLASIIYYHIAWRSMYHAIKNELRQLL